MNRFILLAALLFFFTSCKEEWTDEYKQQYRETCLIDARKWANNEDKAKAYCECSLNVVMKHYPTIEEVVYNKDSIAVQQELKLCRDGDELKD